MSNLKWKIFCSQLSRSTDDTPFGEFKMKRFALFMVALSLLTCSAVASRAQDRIEDWKGKTVMVFTPHPDDDVFGCGGTLALLARNGNKIVVVIYTNDNKGSFDLEMTSERLARIRKAEEEAAMEVIRSEERRVGKGSRARG